MKAVLQADGTYGFEKWGPNEWIDVDPREIDWNKVISKFPKKAVNRDIWVAGNNILSAIRVLKENPQLKQPFRLMYPGNFSAEWRSPTLLGDLEDYCKKENAELAGFFRSQLQLADMLSKGLLFTALFEKDSVTRYRIVKAEGKVKEEGGELLMLGGGSDAKVHPDDDGIVKTYSLKEFWIKGHLDDSSPLLCRYL